MSPSLRVLAVAYACAPGHGSEPAAGWGLTRAVADEVDLTVLVGARHGAAVAAWRAAHPDARGRYVTVAEPMRPRAPRTSPGLFLRYLHWLREAVRVGRALHEEQPFDVVWHCSYAAYWLPSPATDIGPPLLWGPVGGAVVTPASLWPVLGLRGAPAEVGERTVVRAAARSRATRRTMRSAAVTVVQNDETLAAVDRHVRGRPIVLNHALVADREEAPAATAPTRGPYVLHLSRLESRKAPTLPVRALAATPPHVRLVFAGDGPERRAVGRLAARLGVGSRVSLLGRVPHEQVFSLIAGADAVVFTGLREEGGIALAETLLVGTPAIVLALGGARTIAAAAPDPDRVALVEPTGLADTVRQLAAAMTRFTDAGPARPRTTNLDRDATIRRLVDLLHAAAGTVPSEAPGGE